MRSVACSYSSLDGLRQGTRELIKSHGCSHHPRHSTAESIDELKSPLMRVKEQSEKSGLKVNAKKTMMEGTPEDEMVGWPHQLNGHEIEQAPENSEGQGSLACRGPWGHSQTPLSD